MKTKPKPRKPNDSLYNLDCSAKTIYEWLEQNCRTDDVLTVVKAKDDEDTEVMFLHNKRTNTIYVVSEEHDK